MNNINLHGRLPEDLPDKMTIDDILLELEDTNKFDIKWTQLNDQITNIGTSQHTRTIKTAIWRGNNKSFDQWTEHGQVSVFKCDYDPTFNFEWIVIPTTSNMRAKEYRYDIFRYPIRLKVKLIEEAPDKDGRAWSKFMIEKSKIVAEVEETYLRLKDYLGPDVIQDQLSYVNFTFTIDFMLSEVTEICS